MCGIAGCAGPAAAGAPLEAMARLLGHRGPDARTGWRGEGVAFAHARLSVIDVDGGAQPYASEDGRVTAVFNGEIYNFAELRATLQAQGHRFRSRADGEVLVHLYEEEGDAFPARLRGMFAAAVWDAGRSRLLLARDPWGVKPLVVRQDGASIWFASEAKALAPAGLWKPEVTADRLAAFLAYGYFPSPATADAAVLRLSPGHLMVWEDGAATVRPYAARPVPAPPADVREAEARLGDLLREGVRLRLVSDVPVGAFLSGGLDSSLVTALMREAGAADLHTFSISVAGRDESAWALKAATHLGTRHHVQEVGPGLLDELPAAASHWDEPLADPAYLPNLALARLARETVKVCLSGDGADEAFLGYRRYAWIRDFARSPVDGLPAGLRAALFGFLGLRRWALTPARRYGEVLCLATREETAGLLDVPFEDPARRLDAMAAEAGVEAFRDFDLATWLPDDILAKVDLSSMACGLEVRSPFLDVEVMAFARSLPAAWMFGPDGEGKAPVKAVAAALLPPDLVHRPKQGFDLPLAAWLGVKGEGLLERLEGPAPFFRADGVKRLLLAASSGDARAALRLWTVLCFLAWARSHGVRGILGR